MRKVRESVAMAAARQESACVQCVSLKRVTCMAIASTKRWGLCKLLRLLQSVLHGFSDDHCHCTMAAATAVHNGPSWQGLELAGSRHACLGHMPWEARDYC